MMQNTNLTERLNELIKNDEIKDELQRILYVAELSKQNGIPCHLEVANWILCGAPGTGKTMVAKLIGEIYKEAGLLEKGHLVTATRADLIGEYIGQTALKTKRFIQRAMGGVLFIDEADALIDCENGFAQDCIDTLIEAAADKENNFVIVLAGYKDSVEKLLSTHPAFASEFGVIAFLDRNTPKKGEDTDETALTKELSHSEIHDLEQIRSSECANTGENEFSFPEFVRAWKADLDSKRDDE